METFYINVPVSNGGKKVDKIAVFISLLKPGKENAIRRDELTAKCVQAGIISKSTKDKDRAMRNLMSRAKIDQRINITNDGDGEGYYIPTPNDSDRLARNNKIAHKQATTFLVSNRGNVALEEDYKHERITEGE